MKHATHPPTKYKWRQPINESGLMYRTQYLVLNRTVLEAMPLEWQDRFVSLIDEMEQVFDFRHPDFPEVDYRVSAVEKGRFIKDPWGQYNYPNQELIKKILK